MCIKPVEAAIKKWIIKREHSILILRYLGIKISCESDKKKARGKEGKLSSKQQAIYIVIL